MIDDEFTYGEKELASEYAAFPTVSQTIEEMHFFLTDFRVVNWECYDWGYGTDR